MLLPASGLPSDIPVSRALGGMLFFFSGLRSGDYDSLEGELRRTDGCSHVMPGFTLVSNSSNTEGGYQLPALQGGNQSGVFLWLLVYWGPFCEVAIVSFSSGPFSICFWATSQWFYIDKSGIVFQGLIK